MAGSWCVLKTELMELVGSDIVIYRSKNIVFIPGFQLMVPKTLGIPQVIRTTGASFVIIFRH